MRGLVIVALLFSAACASGLQRVTQVAIETPGEFSGYQPPTRDDCQRGLKRLMLKAAEMRHTVTAAEVEPTVMGRLNRELHAITLNNTLTSCGQLEVLGHELGHVMAPPNLHGTTYEQIFADGVSYLVTRALGGYDPAETTGRYLAGMKAGVPVLQLYHVDIERAAAFLTK